jgi:hypothetical protein
MANVMDYLNWRGDLSFKQSGVNEVDNILFVFLCFLDFDGIVPRDPSRIHPGKPRSVPAQQCIAPG